MLLPRQRGAATSKRIYLQPGHLASRSIKLPEAMVYCSLAGLQLKLAKTGARVVRHPCGITFQLPGVPGTGAMVRDILAVIRRLRASPSRPRVKGHAETARNRLDRVDGRAEPHTQKTADHPADRPEATQTHVVAHRTQTTIGKSLDLAASSEEPAV